jgi:hypothetical protein
MEDDPEIQAAYLEWVRDTYDADRYPYPFDAFIAGIKWGREHVPA